MKNFVTSTITAVFIFLFSGCAAPTPIKDLTLPPVSLIEGRIAQLDVSGFTLMDDSGSIYVRAELPDNRKLNLSTGEEVKVYGNLQGGPKRVFDGYVIKKTTGEQIIVSNPSPHFGFVIQSSFK